MDQSIAEVYFMFLSDQLVKKHVLQSYPMNCVSLHDTNVKLTQISRLYDTFSWNMTKTMHCLKAAWTGLLMEKPGIYR